MKRAACYFLALAAFGVVISTGLAETMKTADSDKKTNSTDLATFGGGCFWCIEAVFERLEGVKSVSNGYAGGKKENPTYEEVSGGWTGHAEVIQVEFDPKKVSYEALLDLFWQAHDPTTLNRQGADLGTQYRSIILYRNEAQKAAAEKSKKETAARFQKPIVTEIVPLARFYKAEGYHQGYYRNNPRAPYCSLVIRPKLEKLKRAPGEDTRPPTAAQKPAKP